MFQPGGGPGYSFERDDRVGFFFNLMMVEVRVCFVCVDFSSLTSGPHMVRVSPRLARDHGRLNQIYCVLHHHLHHQLPHFFVFILFSEFLSEFWVRGSGFYIYLAL